MAWGGSLNKDGSDYVRKLKEVERILHFLESFQHSLNKEEKEKVNEVIEIITNNFRKKFERD
jgi:hypothetical protein